MTYTHRHSDLTKKSLGYYRIALKTTIIILWRIINHSLYLSPKGNHYYAIVKHKIKAKKHMKT